MMDAHPMTADAAAMCAVVALEDSILALVSANTVAYQAGYDAAYGSYQDQSGATWRS